ncbi:MAG: hypothetical protein RML40_02605 [Bacteroidota bacterium]|nr:hypothetical protein [Candidatus Kapabacteria bacterium]MDW8219401.1 hypothetical protein [Bacteroidota bacterium]
MISSCTSQRLQDTARFNVEFTEPITNVSKCSSKDADSVLSIYAAREPILVPETSLSKAICRILVVSPCEQERLLPTIIEVPASLIKRVSDLSTPLAPPRKLKPLERTAYRSLAPCCRERSGVGLFDKLELRLAAGYRGAADSVLYPSNAGTVVYRSSLIGFDRGGSSILGGFEVSGLWSIPEIDTSKHLQAGVIAGILPTDGSTFVPVGGHVRYTFRQRPVDEFDPLLADYFTCNSVYLFAQAGVPIDWQTGAPYWGGTWQHQRYFWGVGIGYDIALSCGLDFSIDIGVRQMNLPLPAVDCCSTRFGDMRHPFRASTALLLRLGLTF